MKTYIKTYFYSEHEIQYINAMLEESKDYIDEVILCEFDIHHTGSKREFIFDTVKDQLVRDVTYIPIECHGSNSVVETDNEQQIHTINEPFMRSAFMKRMELDDEDIIVSVDADEIIYRESYVQVFNALSNHDCVRLPLNQFFYKHNYLWLDKEFNSPVACRYRHIKNSFPSNIRDEGTHCLTSKVGAHMSWCMSVDDMIKKLHRYGHPQYRGFADEAVLQDAIDTKTYPFNPSIDFRLRELDWSDARIPEYLRP